MMFQDYERVALQKHIFFRRRHTHSHGTRPLQPEVPSCYLEV